MKIMEDKEFKRTHAEPCLLKRSDHNGTVVICVYVDDCLLTEDRKAIDEAMKDIESEFETRRLGPLDEYSGCSLEDLPDGSKKLVQPDMVKKLEKEFGDTVAEMRDASTPMGPRVTVERPTEDDSFWTQKTRKYSEVE
jgi:Reverse transcriptase (RNA-dependent DNA polymerase)